MRIGIIGLGAMGGRIARRMLESGHDLTVWNRSESSVDDLVAAGATRAGSPSDALQGEIVLSTLFDDAAIEAVLMGQRGLVRAAPGLVHVCMSTITMDFAHRLGTFHHDHGIGLVGAPMLGRPEVIAKGGLNILVSGKSALVDRVEIPLASVGRVWRMGSHVTDSFCAKLSANFMISSVIEATAEAVAVLKGHGVSADRFVEVMTETVFNAPIYRIYGPMVAGQAPPSPSGLNLPIKDNASFLAAAEAANANVPFATAVRDNLRRGVELGVVEADWSTALALVASGHVLGAA